MQLWILIVIIAAGLLLIAALLCAFAVILHKTVFGDRQDKNAAFKYLEAEDFSLETERLSVDLRGVELYSAIYSVKPITECQKAVIFQHGFGAGSSSYMTEIAYLARCGYAVIATDAYGCNNSDGESTRGFYAGAEAVIATFIAVKKHAALKSLPVYLVGHSWGAYSVCCAASKINAEGVVALSAFNAPAQCLCDSIKGLSKYGKLLAPLLHPWFWLVNAFKFGFGGNAKAANRLKKSGAKALLIQGEKDKTVPVKHSAAAKAKGGNITTLIFPDKKHNPYNTAAAEAKLGELLSFNGGEEESKEFYASFDWNAVVEEDPAVMNAITDFIEGK